jgi:hypothetical protein
MHDDDLNAILKVAFPLGHRLLTLEGGVQLINHGAREFAANPRLAVEVLDERAARKFADALIARGQEHVANGERMHELLAAGDESAVDGSRTPSKPHSRNHNTEAGQ